MFQSKKKFPRENIMSHFFVNQYAKSFAIYSSGDKEVFTTFIDKEAIGEIKVSLVKSWKEPRDKYAVIFLR